ncbi:AtpZ/AtpI family protein [Burkholderia thailandensis]|uniref:F0F1-ATPase subunit family protein n=1 Tax=Burkholderia thailandensis TaxID=57975 RepID=A0AAW9CMX5_BURTH|nr:AtpZ/AtpI family protein [Burkholderia thailandensis]MCS3394876.1 AtpZ/AtpI family protein [Burkholderia thailandensis]MCS6428218.1 AtpZ/AtpI family protein [Burkholderia thailandensis]MCS6453406.1 AtpZ/AtpI family protein [Burkholderia thailandensis]MCS6467929.1 AtpZ/AtpI family protein [Burkholderia thailandensis]MCS6482628.1 AtpZ/AtpI family protein [Burkholderia thailandensis]
MTKRRPFEAKRDGAPREPSPESSGSPAARDGGRPPAVRPADAAPKPAADRVAQAARTAATRAARGARDPEPSLGRRLAQIGVLGWTIVAPTLAALAIGRWLDRVFASRVFFSAPLVMLGAALGFWLAWRWMKGQQEGDRDD